MTYEFIDPSLSKEQPQEKPTGEPTMGSPEDNHSTGNSKRYNADEGRFTDKLYRKVRSLLGRLR